ncbi:MAG: hypothetical protein R3B72_15485 [Polyangiaceae bacterium]
MRTALGLLVFLSVAAGCNLKLTTGEGGGGEGGGGDGGSDPGACQGVPTTGECVDDSTIRSCVVPDASEQAVQPKIVEVTCSELEKCEIGINGAECKLQGDCYPGETRCLDASTLQSCQNDATWASSPCGGDSCIAQPGLGAQCLSSSGGTGINLRGHLRYEFLTRNSNLTDIGDTRLEEDGVDFFVTVYKYTDETFTEAKLLGQGLTGAGVNNAPGVWSLELSEPIDDKTFVYFWPMLFDQSGLPRMAMARAENGDAISQFSTAYWVWGFPTCAEGTGECGTEDLGTQLIDIESGSGAANIYRWMDYGIFRFEDLYPGADNLTFAIFWEPGNDYNCGNCFVPPAGGGAEVLFDAANNQSDHFASSINISGSGESPTMWAESVIGHEFGHWVMQSYTKSPGEGGVHFVDAASAPGLSYSEGFATFTGQAMLSNSPSDNEPIYFTKKSGTTFWVDISQNTWSGGALELPNPNGPVDQDINENVVASMFWSFWASGNAPAPQSMGDAPVYNTFREGRLLNNEVWNRGYHTVDMVDYLDALSCSGNASSAQINAVADSVDYPWDGNANCP